MFIDHFIASQLIGSVVGGFLGGLPKYIFIGWFVGAFLFSPMSWWFIRHAKINSAVRPTNVFYENNLSPEEIERIQAIDMIETLGSRMAAQPGYGYFHGDAKHIA